VYSLARRLGLNGWVRNTSAGVEIEVDGSPQALQAFARLLREDAPALARIDELQVEALPAQGFAGFEIVHSEPLPGAFQPISPDVSICPDCLGELFDPSDRRYRYPFINCTNCGPRLTIIQDIPYDRPNTTMAGFPLCPRCSADYQDPLDRRFHAQPVACSECGPRVWLEEADSFTLPPGPLLSPEGREKGEQSSLLPFSRGEKGLGDEGDQAIRQARALLKAGKILAIKGLGGFHLACDATNAETVAELRRRKQRVDKPFALMAATTEMAAEHCLLSPAERALLELRQRPIVILRRRPDSPVAEQCAPGQHTLGMMLPYTPLHYLLFADPQAAGMRFDMPPLVMTSGNLSEEPICTQNEEALARLAGLADAFLMHNRDIHVRCDDSVVRLFPTLKHELLSNGLRKTGQARSPDPTRTLYPQRRARGFAPDPLQLSFAAPPLLAAGAELKNTFCLARQRYAFLSHHIGDMENYETLRSYEDGVAHYQRLFRITPELLAYDLHPDYLATRYALERAAKEGLSALGVQHHHAHIAACLAEHGLDEAAQALGVAFDGVGYGPDGAIWGGEFLLAGYNSYERLAHLRYAPLPGGDAAARQPWRMALAWLHTAGLAWEDDLPPVRHASGLGGPVNSLEALRRQLELGLNSPATSSLGRLFDAVAALIGVRMAVNYEAQAAIELEALVDPHETLYYPMAFENGRVDPSPMLAALLADRRSGAPTPVMAARFHNGVAQMVFQVCRELSRQSGVRAIALSGGVWQNTHLLALTVGLLQQVDFTVYLHRQAPANDGGLALGQAAIAAARAKSGQI
jgi:hydrogenase maturation protein HypF